MTDTTIAESIEELKTEVAVLRAELMLVGYDTQQIREQIDMLRQELRHMLNEPIGIAPNTLPPDFIPMETM